MKQKNQKTELVAVFEEAPITALELRENQTTGRALTQAQMVEDFQRHMENEQAAISPNTLKKYAMLLEGFRVWCESENRSSLPAAAGTVAKYVEHLATTPALTKTGKVRADHHSNSTILLTLAAIAKAHTIAGLPSPTATEEVHKALKAVQRGKEGVKAIGTAQKPKAALGKDELKSIIRTLNGGSISETRDKALLLVGFSGAFRRSELVGLTVDDITRESVQGRSVIKILVRHSKTDQTGEGRYKYIYAQTGKNAAQFCPVKALEDWLKVTGLHGADALFPAIDRHGHIKTNTTGKAKPIAAQDVARVLKRRAEAVNLDASVLAGHSLRRGFVTEAVKANASVREIMYQTWHESVATVNRYISDELAKTDNAAAKIRF